MNPTTDGVDVETKRWLIGLGVAALICAGLVGYEFIRAVTARTDSAPAAPVAEVQPAGAPDWTTTEIEPTTPATYFPDLPKDPPPILTSNEIAAAAVKEQEAYVHQQAAYLRQLAKDPKGQRAIGCLSEEKIADMEKKGTTIW